ncbi:MAG: hypothetical protein ACREP9_12465 [Candidatus Dormibacteraceae bacterium]
MTQILKADLIQIDEIVVTSWTAPGRPKVSFLAAACQRQSLEVALPLAFREVREVLARTHHGRQSLDWLLHHR